MTQYVIEDNRRILAALRPIASHRLELPATDVTLRTISAEMTSRNFIT